MCLPDFIEFKQIEEVDPIVGYRNWRLSIEDDKHNLLSETRNYVWDELVVGPHEVKSKDSGIYAYNYYDFFYYYNNNYNNNCDYNNGNYYYNYHHHHTEYRLGGIIEQYGKVAIHREGQRSEYAKIKTLFSIREGDANGSEEFLDWIKIFNIKVEQVSKLYNCNVISWQDFTEQSKIALEAKAAKN